MPHTCLAGTLLLESLCKLFFFLSFFISLSLSFFLSFYYCYLLSSFIKNSCDWAIWIIQANIFTSVSLNLIKSGKSPLPCKVTYSQALGSRTSVYHTLHCWFFQSKLSLEDNVGKIWLSWSYVEKSLQF
jgi:hypothetical protein